VTGTPGDGAAPTKYAVPVTLDHLALSRATVDRAAARRAEPGLLDALLADPSTQVLLLDGQLAPVAAGPHVVLVDPPTALAFVAAAWPDDAPVERLYLGRGRDGAEHVALARLVPP